MTSLFGKNDLWGPLDPAADAGYDEQRPKRKGFFTDTSICIGCKACEVACKEWNDVPSTHFDMTATSSRGPDRLWSRVTPVPPAGCR